MRMKKMLAALCAIAMAVSAASMTVSAAEPYTDVSDGDWFHDAVVEAHDRGLMLGMETSIFGPSGSLTRAQYVTILFRIHGASAGVPDFTDVAADAWYAGEVGWAQDVGVVGGYDDGSFGPDKKISRQELMVMTARYLDYAWLDLPDSPDAVESFADEDKIADWAAESVERLRRIALVKGDNGNFNPEATATRAESATMIVRLAKAIDNCDSTPRIASVPLSEYSLYTDQPDFADLEAISSKLEEISGVKIGAASDAGEKTIVFTVDDTLRMLEYSVKEKDGVLTFAVYTRYALPYMDKIIESFFAERRYIAVPAGYEGSGTYTLDSVSSFPEGTSFSFAGETNKNPLSYECGEDVTYRISMLQGNRLVSAPTFNYDYRTDDRISKSENVPGYTGQIILTLPGAKHPGTSKLNVHAASAKGINLASIEDEFIGSVAFDFNDITTAKPAPSDFKQFWDSEMKSLMAAEPEEIEFKVCESITEDDYDIYDAVIGGPGGPAYCHITVPKNAAPGSLQIVANYQGYGFSSVGAPCSSNAINVSVTPHSFPNDQPDEFYEEQSKLIDCSVGDGDTREECYFNGMLKRDIQAVRYAEKKFADLWDGKNIVSSGGSMGGFQAVAVGALYSEKVTRISTSITWMCDLGAGDAGRNTGWGTTWSEAGQYYDTCYFAALVKCPVTGFAGLGDYTSQPTGIIAMYNAIKTDKSIVFAQNQKHGGGAGKYNLSYSVAGDPTSFDLMEVVIRDNGAALPAPVYGNDNDRELSANEELLKASVESLSKVRWLDMNIDTSEEITVERMNEMILGELEKNHSLPAGCRVETDSDVLAQIRLSCQNVNAGGGLLEFVEYIVYDSSNGHYSGKGRVSFTKIVVD